MTAEQLLADLRARGVRLWVADDQLRFSAPKGSITDDVRVELTAHKRALMALLSASGGAPSLQQIAARHHNGDIPLSFAQERLWFLEQLVSDAPLFNMDAALRLTVPVNATVLRQTLDEITRRHEVLRTRFPSTDGRPVQVVSPPGPVDFQLVDLQSMPRADAEIEGERLALEEARRPFDLAVGPLVRVRLATLGPTDHLFILTMHHIVSDGWSMQIFFDELTQLYSALAMGRPSPLPELPIQYADFAVWQRQWLKGDVLDDQLAFWRDQLADLPVLQLPTDRPRPTVESYQGAHQPVSLDRQLTDALKTLAVTERASLFMVLLAGFASVLGRYTAQDDVVVGTYIAGRNRAEIERLIGFFINTLVLRIDLSGDPTFRQLLGRVRDTSIGAFDHQDLPFPRLVEELQPSRDLSRNPLFQVVFQLFNAPNAANGDGPSAQTTVTVERGTSVFDLVVSLAEVADGLSGSFEFNTDLFDASTMTRLAGHWSTLLTSATADPDRPLSQLDLLTEREHAQLVSEWNDTDRPYPLRDGLIELFDAAVAAHPDRVAFSCGEEDLTYAELDRRATAVAALLHRHGVGPDVVVGLCLERSLGAVVGVLAIFKAGGAYLPLDPGYPHPRLRFMLADSGAKVLLTSSELQPVFDDTGVAALCVDLLDGEAGQQLPPLPSSVVSPDDLAYVIYTSGSTGTPKGVAVPHRQVLNRLQWMWEDHPFGQGEVACQKTPLSFVDSLWELFGSLLTGVPTVLIPDDVVKDPVELVRLLQATNVSRIWLVPSLLRSLVDTYPDLQARLPALRFWVTSGEALTGELLEQFRRAMPDAALYNLYGTSEVWDVTWYDTRRLTEVPWHVPIGEPIANMRAHVLDADLRPVPVGVPGELCVGGAGVARGYLGHPELTAERFVADPFSGASGAKLYRTGDVARRRADGNIEYLGRHDHQVKIRGFRVELAEIETALRRQPGVQQAVVDVNEDGQDSRLVAFIVQDPEYHGEDEQIDWDSTQVPQWREIWDETYARTPADGGGSFNTAGFTSSFSGLAIPDAEVEEWVGNAVDRILALNPERVLEIGCGTGLVLLRVAPHCSAYWGTDLSPNAIRLLTNTLESAPALQHVRLFERPADDFDGFGDVSFDVVVLNSVVQYFPSVDYLVNVLDSVVAGGGVRAVFLGDVRSLPLLGAFHTAVELARAPASMPASTLRTRIHERIAREKELVIDPALFTSLAGNLAAIDTVDIRLKRGRHNEFASFRYDVTLGIGNADDAATDVVSVDCRREAAPLDEVRARLTDGAPDRLVLRGVPNARTATAAAAWRLLDEDGELATVGQVRDATSAVTGVDPEQLWALADEVPYDVDVTWSGAGSDGDVDAWFTRRGTAATGRRLLAAAPPRRTAPLRALANNPRQGMFTASLVPRLRATLERELPEHMLPSSYVLLDELPLTPSGKIDRLALASHGRDRGRRDGIYEAPRSALETVVVGLFADVLGVDDVGIRDNFFNQLGGHSLLATQLVSRLREALTIELPLRWAFEEPTAAGLAARLLDESPNGARIQRRAELLVELDTMTDDEVESMLLAKRP